MISLSTKLSGNVAGLGPNTANLFRKAQMEKLGNFGIATVKARVARGIGSDDAMMKDLKHGGGTQFAGRVNGRARFRPTPGYGAWKTAHGLQPIRDLTGDGKSGGHMLDNLTVRSVTESTVRMAFTARLARIKALANERRAPWLSFSPNDERIIVRYAEQMFRSQVEILRRNRASGARLAA